MMSELTAVELEETIGSTAMREYLAAPDWDRPKIEEWAIALRTMSDEKLVSTCSIAILNSALVINSGANFEGDHARASACHHESKRRKLAAGHTSECHGSTLYDRGLNRAYRSQGHQPPPLYACTCGANK